ncbi:MAG: SRPBCC family protein [Flavobacterium sp.]
MATTEKISITVATTVNTPVEKAWEFWTKPEHITQWNNASEDWHSPKAENDLRKDGKFNFRMEAKDGSMGFDFNGIYTNIITNKSIEYAIEDGRKVSIDFNSNGQTTTITETFEAEDVNSIELQKNGWQAILNNFKKYIEAN